MTEDIIIRPTAVFNRPNYIVAGNIILSPKIFPKNIKANVYLASGKIKSIMIHSEITTSPDALRGNLHGFTYSGDIIDEEDLEGDVLISTVPFDKAYQQFKKYKDES